MKYIPFSELVKRLEAAFPEFDIAAIERIQMADARNRVPVRIGWKIGIAEKVEDGQG
jgi:hypothetical protein